MIEKLGGLKLPPFKYAVSGPSLCPGHLYRVDSRSDEHRAEFFAVTALAAAMDLPAIGWWVSPAVVVGQKPHRQIAHPIIVDELRPAQTAQQ